VVPARSVQSVTDTPNRQTHDPERIWRKRIEAGLTMPQLAERAGVGLGTVSRAEMAGKAVNVVTLRRLAEGLNCEISELMPRRTSGVVMHPYDHMTDADAELAAEQDADSQ
jgi:transcriptional regulator with XRE-family HTH domain